jgi:selenocysteine lyase/cysteine desulfurase
MASLAALPLDPARLRALFPAFSEPSLAGQAHFEYAGGSYVAAPVLGRFERYLRANRVQPYGYSQPSRSAGDAMDLAYSRVAAMLNVGVDWIHFGPSTSANTYVLSNAFAAHLRTDDVVVVTNQDHEANSGAWRRLAARGIVVREWRVDAGTGRLDLAALDDLLDGAVKLVAFPHCSNIVGEINPARTIVERAHSAGALCVVDGVAYAPHGPPDLAAIGADVYLFSAYKTYGPHVGVMAIRPDLAAALPNQGHFFNDGKLRYRLTPAGPDHAQIAAMAGVADYLEAVAAFVPGDRPAFRRAHDAMRAQEAALLAPLMDWLRGRNDVRIVGPTDAQSRAPTVSLAVLHPADLAGRLGQRGIMAGAGNFYVYRLMEALGLDPHRGVLRLSFLHFTTPAEIEALIAALDQALAA